MSRLNKLFEQTKETPEYKRKAARAAVTADLRVLIANANKSQKEVAEHIGITPAALSAKLSGTKNLTLDSIVDIADAVGAAVDLVFRPAGSKRVPQMWEARAETDRVLDRATALLKEVEELHAKQQAMQETLSSATRMAFRNRQGRSLAQDFEVRTVCVHGGYAPSALVANGF